MTLAARKVRFVMELRTAGVSDTKVLAAMERIARERFVPELFRDQAYDNIALPIGGGQTISQPMVVARMTQALLPDKKLKVLEIGTGSGYQTAVLSRLVKKVYSMEIIDELRASAAARLAKLHYTNIDTRTGNGYLGWPEHAPYDGIIVTAAASYIPPALVEQLKPGGRLVIPVGEPFFHQELMLVKKDDAGATHTQSILGVAFVPMVDKELEESAGP